MQRETRCVSSEGRLTRVQLQEDNWAGDTQECSFFLDDVASIVWTLAALAPSIMCGDTLIASAEPDSGSEHCCWDSLWNCQTSSSRHECAVSILGCNKCSRAIQAHCLQHVQDG